MAGDDKAQNKKTTELTQGEVLDTYPKFLLHDYKNYPDRIAMRKKDFGIWNIYTWAECYQNIKHFALGLTSLGLKEGDKVCILGENDPEWIWAELAVQAMRAIPTGIFVDSMPDEIKYQVQHSQSSFVLAKDQEQTDKLLKIKDEIPFIQKVIYWEPKGMWAYEDNPWIMDFKDVMKLGEEYEQTHPGLFEESIAQGKADDPCVICYTSGTTGLPKGVRVSHDYIINSVRKLRIMAPYAEEDEYLSFSPPAWLVEQFFGIGSWLLNRIRMNFAEEIETVLEDLREIGAVMFLFGARQWEDLISRVQARINDTSAYRRLIYNLSLPVGYNIADFRMRERRQPSLFWRIVYGICNFACFRPIRDYLGLSKLKTGVTAGSILGPEQFRWFRAIGVNIVDIYGTTEATPTSGYGIVKPGTGGQVTPEAELRISDEGEVLEKVPHIFDGYYRDPEATAARVTNGWVSTGDCGTLDDEGYVIIYDRLKDMVNLKGGGKYSPYWVENRLKFSPYIKDGMVVGGEDKDYLFAIITIDFVNVGRWAERKRIPYTTYVDLSQKPEVYDLVYADVDRVNKTLPPNAKLKRYSILHKEFDPDEGDLTRTRKIKRTGLEQRYAKLIDAAYKGESQVMVEAAVTYQDGRKGKITTAINIKEVE